MRSLKKAMPIMLSLLVGLISLTATQASAAQNDLGVLQQLGEWKIGTVDAGDGQVYCAMVNQFDKDTVLAFSRNKFGDNSIAVDFQDQVLVEGVKYAVNLELNRSRSYSRVSNDYAGTASSPKSLVVNIGDDQMLLNALKKDGRLKVSLSPIEAAFEVRKFMASYVVLMDCAGSLNDEAPKVASAPVSRVDKAQLEENYNDKFSSLKETYEEDLSKQENKSVEKINSLNARYEELTKELEEQKAKVDSYRMSHNEQKMAQRAMEEAIAAKDSEISKLKESQKQYLKLIEDLTQQKQDLLTREKSAENTQKELSADLLKHKQKINELQAKYDEAMRNKDDLTLQISRKEADVASLRDSFKFSENVKVKELEDGSKSLLAKIDALQKQNDSLKIQIEAARSAARTTEETVLSKKNIEIEDLVNEYRGKLTALQENYSKLKIEKDRLEDDLKLKRKEVEDIRQSNLDGNNFKVQEMRKHEQELSARISRLEENNVSLQAEIDSARKAVQDAEEMAVNRKSAELMDVLNKHKSRVAQLENKYRSQEDVKRNLRRELDSKEKEIAAVYQADLQKSEGKISDLLMEERKLSGRVQELEIENQRLQMQMSEMQRALDDAKKISAYDKNVELTKLLDQHEKRIADLKAQYDEQQVEQQKLRDELAAKDLQIAQAQQKSSIEGDRTIAELKQREQDLFLEIEKLRGDNERLRADIGVARRVMMQSGYATEDAAAVNSDDSAALPEIITQQMEKTSRIAESFTDAKKVYEEKLQALQRERNDLAERIEMLELENKSYKEKTGEMVSHVSNKDDQVKDLESRMLAMAQQREEIKDALRAAEEQVKVLDASLKAKDQNLNSRSSKYEEVSEKLAETKSELLKTKGEKEASVSDLQRKLQEKTDQYELLRKQFETRMGAFPKEQQLAAAVALQEETVANFKRQLDDTDVKISETVKTIAQLRDAEKNKSEKLSEVSQDRATANKQNIDRLGKDRENALARLSSAREERDRIRRNISGATVGNAPINLVGKDKKEAANSIKGDLSNIEIQLASAGQQKQELADMLDKRSREVGDRLDDLRAEKDELSAVKVMFPKGKKRIAEIDAEISKLEYEQQHELKDMKAKLADKVAEYDALEREFDKKSKIVPDISKLEIELDLKNSSIAKLEDDLANINVQLKKATLAAVEDEKSVDDKQIEFAEDLSSQIRSAEQLVERLKDDKANFEAKLNKESVKLGEMQKELDEVTAANGPLKDVNARLQEQLSSTNKHASDVELELEQARRDNRVLAAKIDELINKNAPVEQHGIALQQELTEAKSRIATMQFDLEKAADRKEELAAKLKAQDDIIDSLRKEVEESGKAIPSNFKKAVDLELKKSEVARLEAELGETRERYKEAMQGISDAQVKISELSQARSTEAEGLAKQLLAAEAEIYKMKSRITEMEANAAPIIMAKDRAQAEMEVVQKRLSEQEAELITLAQEKQALAIRLEERSQQVFALQDELARKEQELADIRGVLEESNRLLMVTRAEVDNLKPEYTAVVNDLMSQLKNKIAQYDDLQQMYNRQVAAVPALEDVEAELTSNRQNISILENKLAQVSDERRKAKEDAIKARAALEKAYVRMDSLNGTLASPAAQASKIEKIEQKQQLQLEQVDQQKSLESAEMSMNRQKREQELATITEEKQVKQADVQQSLELKPKDESVEAKKTISKAEDFLNKVMAYHRSGGAIPMPKESSSYFATRPADLVPGAAVNDENKPTDVQDLLRKSGVAVESYTPVEETQASVVSQWNSGRISGMYEQAPVMAPFQSQVNSYIDRYKEDCADGLKVKVGPAQKVKDGEVITADLECDMPSNSYANSILFLKNKGGFVSIVHTAYPTEKARVKTVRDSMLRNLKRSGGFETPVKMKNMETSTSGGDNDKGSAAAPEKDDLETIVIE